MTKDKQLSIASLIILLILDQGSKIWVQANVPLHKSSTLIPNFIDLTYVQNKGVSFSFMADWPDMVRLPLLIGISSIAVLVMGVYLFKYWDESDVYLKIAFTLILPGALGNLVDRVLYGAVTDFMHFKWYDYSFFVNNLADCFISVGVVFFAISTFVSSKQDATSEA